MGYFELHGSFDDPFLCQMIPKNALPCRQDQISRYPVGAMNSFDASSSVPSKGRFKTIGIGISVAVFLAVVFFIARASGSALPQGIVLYWGEGCPHCANVEAFIQENDVESTVSFTRKEVYLNKANAREMGRVAKQCGFSTTAIGVPFMWTGAQCLSGEKEIIAFFQQMIQ